MKLFPQKFYIAELKESSDIALKNLERNTKLTPNLISQWGVKKDFIGQVNENGFKIISSIVGFGALCVLSGKIINDNLEIEVRLHRAFKVLFSILLSYPFIGFVIISLANGISDAIRFIPLLIFGLLGIRFVFMALSYRIMSKIALNKLTQTFRVEQLTKSRHNTV